MTSGQVSVASQCEAGKIAVLEKRRTKPFSGQRHGALESHADRGTVVRNLKISTNLYRTFVQ